MRRILITGSSRGIGLELVRDYLQRGETRVLAACRHPAEAKALNALAAQYPDRLTLIAMDVSLPASIEAAAEQIRAQVDGLDILINNAGIYPGGVDDHEASSAIFGSLETDAMLKVFHVNTVAPVMIAQVFADLLRQGSGARLINMSSDAGSLTMRNAGGNYSYPASKAALNMMTRCLAHDLQPDGVIVISIHPGWIQTEMGGQNAPLTLGDAVPVMMDIIDSLTPAESGTFLNWNGTPVPW